MTESQHPRAQTFGARRRLRSTIPPSRYKLWQYERHAPPTMRRPTDQEDLTAPTGYNILSLRFASRWSGRYSEARQPRSKGGSGAQRHKTMTKAKDTPPAPGRRATKKPNMEYPKRQDEAEARTKRAIRQKARPSDVRRSSTEPQPSSEEPERQPGRVTTGQDPRNPRNHASSVRAQENGRIWHFRTSTLRTENHP